MPPDFDLGMSDETIALACKNLGLDVGEDSTMEILAQMSKDEIFDCVLRWEGIIGYGESIKRWVEGVYGIELDSTESAK